MNCNEIRMPVKTIKQWKKQDGMTGIGIAIIIALIAFFALITLRLFPIYMEHFNVASHLESMAADESMKNKENHEIKQTLSKRFQIDDVSNVKDEHVSIIREDGGVTVSIDYEVRTPALGNVDMVVTFSDEVKLN